MQLGSRSCHSVCTASAYYVYTKNVSWCFADEPASAEQEAVPACTEKLSKIAIRLYYPNTCMRQLTAAPACQSQVPTTRLYYLLTAVMTTSVNAAQSIYSSPHLGNQALLFVQVLLLMSKARIGGPGRQKGQSVHRCKTPQPVLWEIVAGTRCCALRRQQHCVQQQPVKLGTQGKSATRRQPKIVVQPQKPREPAMSKSDHRSPCNFFRFINGTKCACCRTNQNSPLL